MKMTLEQAEVRFGKETINKLVNMPAEPTGRLIYPSSEPQHADMDEYMAGSVYVDGGKLNAYYFQPSGGKLNAYYFQPSGADEWEFGEMNGIKYGDIDNIEFVEDCD